MRALLPLLLALAALVPAAGASAESAAPAPFSPAHFARLWDHAGDGDLLLGLGVGAGAALLVAPWDDQIVDRFVEHEPLGPGGPENGRWIGHRRVVAGGFVLLTGGGLLLGEDSVRDTGLLFLEAHLLSAGLTEVLKRTTGRTRPDGSNDKSFPSGHAVSAMTSATVLQRRFGWWVGGPAYLAAAYCGLSRIQAEKHHPSDVAFGFGLAWWVASAVCRAAEPGAEDDGGLTLLPPPHPGDAGLALVRLRF